MATKRKTAKDYRDELEDLITKKEALEARIIKRAKELCKEYPVVNFPNGIMSGDCVNIYLSVDASLSIIEAIEADLANKHPPKQTKIEGFN